MFNCPDVSPTIEQIDQSFGATRPGVYDEERRRFTLTFRGLAFEFPAETKFQPSYGGSRRELGRLQFPPGQSPTVSHMIIISPSSPSYHHHHHHITIITIISGQSPTVSHMSIYSGPSLADCAAPPAPPSRLPTLEARRVDVVRSGGRTVGANVAIEIFIIDIVYRWVLASSLRRSLGNSPGAVCLVPRRMASLPA